MLRVGKPSWVGWVLLLLIVGASGVRFYRDARQYLVRAPGTYHFWDLKVMLDDLKDYEQTGRLYHPERSDFLHPGSPGYRYPPPFAVALLPLLKKKIPHMRQARPFVRASLIALGLFLGTMLVLMRPNLPRALFMVAVFLNWQSHWENIAGPQMEPFMIVLFALTLALARQRKLDLAGIPLGIAGAFKVYPWLLAWIFLPVRRWRLILGVAVGALLTLGICSLVIPPRYTIEFFTEILPHMGGVSLGFENVSALANLGRLAYAVTGDLPPTKELAPQIFQIFQNSGPPNVRTGALLVYVPLALAMGFITLRAIGQKRALPWEREQTILLGLAPCPLLFLLPTSWVNYQEFLLLSILGAIALVRSPRHDWVSWMLLIASALLGALAVEGSFWGPHEHLFTVLRSLLPVTLWVVHLRLLASPTAIEPLAARAQSAPSVPRTI